MKLTDRPNPEHIKKNPEGYDYIPIGLVEQTLDELCPGWSIFDQTFSIVPVGEGYLATATVTLDLQYEDTRFGTAGAHSMYISPRDLNTNYSATCLSYAIANAAKRRGILFGRDLNGRCEIGETGLPVIQLDTSKKTDEEIAKELESITIAVTASPTKEDALLLIENSGFKFNIRLKEIANSKPSKNK